VGLFADSRAQSTCKNDCFHIDSILKFFLYPFEMNILLISY
jgi:hypothetical protein